MRLAHEFKEFLLKQNALALAIAVVLGAAVAKLVSGLVDDLIMPVIGLVLPGADWRNAQLVLSGTNAIRYGDLLGRALDFTIIAAVVFLVVRTFLREKSKAATRVCPACRDTVPAQATRCRACTEILVEAQKPGERSVS
ncbi:MAG: large conductance mechanosensitive channel protein MscL [Deltaproteobacteria bacterium]|nr:large conductance mechanosensitive channel protein MscL [Deltaproteobacteria bacterium]